MLDNSLKKHLENTSKISYKNKIKKIVKDQIILDGHSVNITGKMFVQTLRKPCQNVPCLLGMTFWVFLSVYNWYFIYEFTSLLLAQQIQMLHILCGTDALSQRMMENIFVSQAGVSYILFYTSTANYTTQQDIVGWLSWQSVYYTLFFSLVFSEKEGQHNAAIQLFTLLYVLNSPTDSVALT